MFPQKNIEIIRSELQSLGILAPSDPSKIIKKLGCDPRMSVDELVCGNTNLAFDIPRRAVMEACPNDPKCYRLQTTENGREYVSCKAVKEEDQKHCQGYNDEFESLTVSGYIACSDVQTIFKIRRCDPRI